MLDKERLKVLLREADDRWFNHMQTGKDLSYQAQLEHTADYLAKNYDKGRGNGSRKLVPAGENQPQPKDSHPGKKSKKGPHMLDM
jgi:hypothetical protein